MEQTTRSELRKLSDVARRKSVTDTSGSPSETYRPSVLSSMAQHFNDFVHGLRSDPVDEFALMRATELRVAEALYPKKIERRVNG